MCGPGNMSDGVIDVEDYSCDSCRYEADGASWYWSAPPAWRVIPSQTGKRTRLKALLSNTVETAIALVCVSAALFAIASPYRGKER